MRGLGMLFLVLGLPFCFPLSIRAGLYNTEEPPLAMGPNTGQLLGQMQMRHSDYLRMGHPESLLRKEYLKRIAELEAKEARGGLSVAERVNLGACYLRLGQVAQKPEEGQRLFEKAIAILTPAATPEKQNFMVLANLSLAYQLSGHLGRALAYLEQALTIWPATWPGMDTSRLKWYRRVEKYHLQLLQLRSAEEERPRGQPPGGLDALFPRVRFTSADGTYKAGELAPAQSAELPPDAIFIVGYLLLSMPTDARLAWLLGELFNAQGDVLTASTILKDLVERGVSAPELREHRRVLEDARQRIDGWQREMTPAVQLQLLWLVRPRFALVPPGVGPLANESGAAAALECLKPPKSVPPSRTADPAPAAWLPNLRDVIVSFVAGALVAFFIILQVAYVRGRGPQRKSRTDG